MRSELPYASFSADTMVSIPGTQNSLRQILTLGRGLLRPPRYSEQCCVIQQRDRLASCFLDKEEATWVFSTIDSIGCHNMDYYTHRSAPFKIFPLPGKYPPSVCTQLTWLSFSHFVVLLS